MRSGRKERERERERERTKKEDQPSPSVFCWANSIGVGRERESGVSLFFLLSGECVCGHIVYMPRRVTLPGGLIPDKKLISTKNLFFFYWILKVFK